MTVVGIRNLSAGYGNRAVLANFSAAEMRAGQVVSLVGPNAAGKSTLLRAIAGLIPASGEIVVNDKNILRATVRERAAEVAFMPQTLPQGADLIVLEAVITALSASPHDDFSGRHSREKRAVMALTKVGLLDQLHEPLDRLSGGQRQLVGIAQAIVRNPKVLLLDEPTSALDVRNQIEIMAVIRSLAEEGHIIIVVMHDLNLAARWSDRIMLLHRGMLLADGIPQETITPENLAAAYGVDVRVERCSKGYLQVIADRPLQEELRN